MNKGDVLIPVFPRGYWGCNFCGCADMNLINTNISIYTALTWSCGFDGHWVDDKMVVDSPCSKYSVSQETVVSSHPCTCDIMLLMRKGCICGGE